MTTCFRIALFFMFSSFSLTGQGRINKLDSLISLIPSTTGESVIVLFGKVQDELNKLPGEERVQKAKYILERAESTLKSKGQPGQFAALYWRSRFQKEIFYLYPEALKTTIEAAEIAEKINDHYLLHWALTQATQISYAIENYSETIRIGEQVIKLFGSLPASTSKESDYSSRMSFITNCNTIGLAYFQLGQYDSALRKYDQSEKMARQVKHEFWITLVGGNKASIYKNQGKYDEALKNLLVNYFMSKKYKDWKIAGSEAMKIAEIYILKNNLISAGHYMDSAAIFIEKHSEHEEDMRVDYWQYIAKLENAKGNYKAAFDAQKRFTDGRIELIRKQQSNLVAAIQGAYDFSRNQRAMEALTHDNELQQERIKFQRTLFIAVLVVLILVVFLAGYFIFNYRRQKKVTSLISSQAEEIESRNLSLNKALVELQNAQDQLVQTEKMAFLGRLTSGIAHEINTPLGAIKASSENVKIAITNIIRQSQRVSTHIPKEQVGLFFELVNHSTLPAARPDFRTRRAAKKALIEMLNGAKIGQPEILAEHLINLGITNDYHRWEALLRTPKAEEILSLIDQTVSANSQNLNIELAVSKASKILYALKEYSHPGLEEGIATEVDLSDNIEMVLSIYSNNLKDVELIKDFESVDKINGFPDELTQVWTNIIHNSLQAMDGKGRIVISIHKHSLEGIRIVISDTGKGIPQENQKRLFEPFFTTKKAGEGTGLGLSIVKKIIDKHLGRIECESELGKGQPFEYFFRLVLFNLMISGKQ